MKANWKASWSMAVACILFAMVAAGCMTERAPIDTTNPLAVDKRLFEGEFFYKETIVDLPKSADYAFIGSTNDLRVIRWEITEDMLLGYNVHAYEETVDTEGTPVLDKAPILAYPIHDHFDIQLAQNSMTGEDLPMKVENRDKAWWERRYFVIDPSSSSINTFDDVWWKLILEWWPPFRVTPAGGYHNLEFHDKTGKAIDPADYEMRHLSGDPDQLIETFSFNVEMIVNPIVDNLRWWYTWDDVMDFNSFEAARIETRQFFWKVHRDELDNNGFERREHQDEMFQAFGYFTTGYRNVDPQYWWEQDKDVHKYAKHFNTSGDNKIIYYLGPEFPQELELTACAIAADYNWAFSKAAYEGEKAKETFEDSGEGFISDWEDQIKLADGLYQIGTSGADPASLFMADAKEVWPSNLKLDDSKYYYLDYTIESQKPPVAWTENGDTDKVDEFLDTRGKMVAEMKRYCFTEDDNDKYILRRNEFLEYDYDRDGSNPEGLPNLITREELVARYGDNIDSRLGVPADSPVACKLTLEHRCELDGNGHKVARWKYDLGDPRYSLYAMINKDAGRAPLGVVQWSDDPETGQIFNGTGHMFNIGTEGWITYELDNYFMNQELAKIGADQSKDRYAQLLEDLIVDPPHAHVPYPGSEDYRVDDQPSPAAPNAAPGVGSEGWHMAMAAQKQYFSGKNALTASNVDSQLEANEEVFGEAERLRALKEKHLPLLANRNLEKIRGTEWETMMSPRSYLNYLYPGATSYDEEMLTDVSPFFWATPEAMMAYKNQKIESTKLCVLESEWFDGGYLDLIQKLDGMGYNREELRQMLRRMMFKSTAEHELGHAIGLRHNFIATADEMNFVGNKTTNTGYWQANEVYQAALAEKVALFEDEKGRKPTAWEKYYLGKSTPADREKYMYSSVMDYGRDAYTQSFGLGKYDIAAILFMYGDSIEKYKVNDDNTIATSLTGEPIVTVEPIFTSRYCSEDDLGHQGCECTPGQPVAGYDDEDCRCIKVGGAPYCYNTSKVVQALRYETEVKLIADNTGKLSVEPVVGETVGIQLNGDRKPYLFCSDEHAYENPMCNTWDKGITATDMMRDQIDSFKKRYITRFFRRGYAKFRRTRWYKVLWRMTNFVLPMLEFNYNQFQLDDWQPALTGREGNPFPKDTEGNPSPISLARKEFLLAINGVEEWEENIEGKTYKKTFVQGGPGDYLTAAMEGYNFLAFDVLNSPDVGTHILSSWKDDPSKQYFEDNPYIYDDSVLDEEIGGAMVEIDLAYGRYHKDGWDRQDDLNIVQTRLQRRGFTEAKEAAMYLIGNTGWWYEKYMMESMANGIAYVSDGLENSIYQLMSDQLNENSLYTVSPLCVRKEGKNEYKLQRYQPPINALYLWNWAPDYATDYWADIDARIEAGEDVEIDPEVARWAPRPFDNSKSFCEQLTENEAAEALIDPEFEPHNYIPVHASWVYFDSMFPAFWAISNMANTMADNAVYEYFYAHKIPAGEHDQWDSIEDDPNAVECLNSKESVYYRTYKFPGDDRTNPIFNMISRCKNIQDLCVNDPSLGQVPGNFVGLNDICGNSGYPRYYLYREMDYIEAKVILLRSYGDFWIDSANLFW